MSFYLQPLSTVNFFSPVLSGVLVARQLLSIIHAVCKDWTSQFPSLSAPAEKLDLSMFGIKNTRRKMEDRYALCMDVNSLYGLQVKDLCWVLILLHLCFSLFPSPLFLPTSFPSPTSLLSCLPLPPTSLLSYLPPASLPLPPASLPLPPASLFSYLPLPSLLSPPPSSPTSLSLLPPSSPISPSLLPPSPSLPSYLPLLLSYLPLPPLLPPSLSCLPPLLSPPPSYLPLPPSPPTSLSLHPTSLSLIPHSSPQGMPRQSFYAVCDGHNGEAAAVYASVHLLTNIVRHAEFGTDLAAAIKGGVRTTDEYFCKKVHKKKKQC